MFRNGYYKSDGNYPKSFSQYKSDQETRFHKKCRKEEEMRYYDLLMIDFRLTPEDIKREARGIKPYEERYATLYKRYQDEKKSVFDELENKYFMNVDEDDIDSYNTSKNRYKMYLEKIRADFA
jgi:hypothetical protein